MTTDPSRDWQGHLEDALAEFAGDSGTLHLLAGSVDDPDATLVLMAHVGMPDGLMGAIRSIPVGKGLAGLAAQRDCPVDSCNIQVDDTGDVRPGARATALQGAIAVPMRRPGGAVGGVLGIGQREDRQWSAEETEKILRFAAALLG
jgi:putative methionine-R-sulfoxide reductase with GAF domain